MPRNRVLLAAALLVVFGVGIALGEALHDNPRPGGEQTSFRTLPPLTATSPPVRPAGVTGPIGRVSCH